MANKRKNYSAQEKVRLLRQHLIEKEPVSDRADSAGGSVLLALDKRKWYHVNTIQSSYMFLYATS